MTVKSKKLKKRKGFNYLFCVCLQQAGAFGMANFFMDDTRDQYLRTHLVEY